MRAVQQQELTGPDGLAVVEVPEPVAGPDRLLVRVAASGVSFPDLLMGLGRYQARLDPPYVPGVEAAGTVVTAPEGSGFAAGDRVAAFVESGGWAELCLADPLRTVRLPDGLDPVAAAGMLMNYLTALFGLERRGRLRAGERVLVHGAAGGLGTACVQVAKGLGAQVVAVVSTPGKAEAARAAGADDVLVGDDWPARLRADVGPVDVVVDVVGEPVVLESLRALAPEGRYLVLGFAGGQIPSVALNRLLLRNVDVVGVAWGAFLAQHPAYVQEQWERLRPMLEAGSVAPAVGHLLPLEQAAEAVRLLADRAATGKVVLAVRQP